MVLKLSWSKYINRPYTLKEGSLYTLDYACKLKCGAKKCYSES